MIQNVTSTTITNCFKHAGFNFQITSDEVFDPEYEITLAKLSNDIDWIDFINVDDQVLTYSEPTDVEIAEEVLAGDITSDESIAEEEDDKDTPTVFLTQKSIDFIKKYVLSKNLIDERIMQSMKVIESEITKSFIQQASLQKKITEYFRKSDN